MRVRDGREEKEKREREREKENGSGSERRESRESGERKESKGKKWHPVVGRTEERAEVEKGCNEQVE